MCPGYYLGSGPPWKGRTPGGPFPSLATAPLGPNRVALCRQAQYCTLHCTLTMGEAVLCCATVCTLLCSAMLSGVVSRCVFTELYCTVLR